MRGGFLAPEMRLLPFVLSHEFVILIGDFWPLEMMIFWSFGSLTCRFLNLGDSFILAGPLLFCWATESELLGSTNDFLFWQVKIWVQRLISTTLWPHVHRFLNSPRLLSSWRQRFGRKKKKKNACKLVKHVWALQAFGALIHLIGQNNDLLWPLKWTNSQSLNAPSA